MPSMRLPKHSTVAAYAALFITLGGVGYAAPKLAANSVGSAQIKPNAITSADIRNGSVGVADLSKAAKGATPTKARIASIVEDVITDPKSGLTINVKGEKGDKGDAGVNGATGPQGPGLANRTVVTEQSGEISANATGGATAHCPAGQVVIGGGGYFTTGGGAVVTSSRPFAAGGDQGAWQVTMKAGTTVGAVEAFAICITPTG